MNRIRTAGFGVAIAILLAATQMQGCVTGLTEQERYAADTRRAERMDEIRFLIKTCRNAGMVPLYYGPTTLKLLDPFERIPSYARLSDYGCASGENVVRAQR